jgi:hypothetical protein
VNVPTDYFFKKCILNVTIGTPGVAVLFGAKLGLFTNTPPLSQTTVLADLTEPTFAGYAQQAVGWSAAFQQPDFSWATQGGLYTFQATNDLTPTVVTGCFLVDGGGTQLIMAEMFDTPVNLPTSAQACLVSPQVAAGNSGWGSNTVIT